jgi:hypothetical protein
MNKLYIFVIALLLTSCSTVVPVTMKFPQAPESLMKPAEPLIPLDKDKRELSDLIDNATYNYGNYYLLEIKYKAWQDWYETQKKIFEEVK